MSEISRRDALKLSAAGVLGASASGWFDVLAARAAQQAAAGVKHKSCILLWMSGGPTHMDTWDLKPNSPNAGEFKPIATAVPGIQISEHLPKLAKSMNDMSIVRGMSTGEGSHGRATYFMHTGFREGLGGVVYPSLGSVVSHELGDPKFELPNFVAVGAPRTGMSPGFLGPKHAPLMLGDPTRGLENLSPAGGLTEFDEKIGLLQEMEDSFYTQFSTVSAKAHKTAYQKAVDLIHSPKAKAFDLALEKAETKARYGTGRFADGCLLARRLVEVGVPFVEVNLGGWDTHQDNWGKVKSLSSQVDPAMSALIADLKERGLLDSTLVIWAGEFGRTPKINSRSAKPGRDHFPRAWSTVFAGGGLKHGQVIGRTDKDGGTVEDRPVNAIDFMATACKALGVDYTKKFQTRDGRPMRIVDKNEKPISEFFA